MKSTKYNVYHVSKKEYPTHIVRSGTSSGTLVVGYKKAQQSVEQKLGRPLKLAKKIQSRGGNWVFLELKEPVA